jgi:hypothetical protein
MVERIEALFPQLRGTAYQVTSPPEDVYNCVAWAATDLTRWWWPGDPERTFWPDGVAREETLSAFREVFARLGYAVCDAEDVEAGYEKIALFADADGVPTHVARQLPGGGWTSKLGRMEDIVHELHDIAGALYGSVVQVMKRPLPVQSGG